MSESHTNGTDSLPKLKVSTVVYLDFEATSLKRPRITELCLLAVSRLDIEAGNSCPRVVNKLALCLDPQKPIDPFASSITGLYNDSLESQSPWNDNVVELIELFLKRLPSPVCLVAHNGNRFDFPLLQAELARINRSLDAGLYCVDSLEAFRELDGLPRQYSPGQNRQINTTQSSPATPVSTPPIKVQAVAGPPPLKRKSIDKVGTSEECKVLKSDESEETGCTANKVKKKLDFNTAEVDAGADKKEETDNKNTDSLGFSESLEDGDYLLALDEVEKSFVQKNDKDTDKNLRDDTNQTKTRIADKDNGTNQKQITATTKPETSKANMGNETDIYQSAETNQPESNLTIIHKATAIHQSANISPDRTQSSTAGCAVASGSGYLVRNVEVTVTGVDKTLENKPRSEIANGRPSPCTEDAVNDFKETPENKSRPDTASGRPCVMNAAKLTESDVDFVSEVSFTSHEVNETSDTKSASYTAGTKHCMENATKLGDAASHKVNEMLDKSTTSNSTSENSIQNVAKLNDAISNKINETSDNMSISDCTSDKLSIGNDVKLSITTDIVKNGSPSVSCVADHTKSSDKVNTVISANGTHQSPQTNHTQSPRTGTQVKASSSPGSPYLKWKSYKLEEIYKRTFGAAPDTTHNAETDCFMLLKIFSKTPKFLDWIDNNACLLSSVQPLK